MAPDVAAPCAVVMSRGWMVGATYQTAAGLDTVLAAACALWWDAAAGRLVRSWPAEYVVVSRRSPGGLGEHETWHATPRDARRDALVRAPAGAAATVPDVLRDARGLLVRHGWGQGEFVDEAGRLCPVGALRRAAGCAYLEDWTSALVVAPGVLAAAEEALAAPLRAGRGRDGEGLPVEVISPWNDFPGRTVVEVLAHLDAVIEGEAALSSVPAGAVR